MVLNQVIHKVYEPSIQKISNLNIYKTLEQVFHKIISLVYNNIRNYLQNLQELQTKRSNRSSGASQKIVVIKKLTSNSKIK